MTNRNFGNYENRDPIPENINGIQPFGDFNNWFASVIEEVKPALVVGIARGAIRLLQLQSASLLLPNTQIISHHALPFISDSEIKSKRILLFDDSVIYGSIMSEMRDYLSKRGAIVFCAAYVVDRFNFYGETEPEHHTYAIPSEFCSLF
ncbi:MAG: phosphoribosyltransferase [Thermodesulfovibrionales bacterium]|nr:phosphoribosyltransferase [Thermodesulfovibrionales bacterium]